MSHLEDALAFDADDRPVQAITSYESAIASSEADVEGYINLAMLYFECVDGGFQYYHQMSDEYVAGALGRAHATLDRAEERFGRHPEVEFWRHYFAQIYGAGPSFYELAAELCESGVSLVPYLYAVVGPGGEQYVPGAKELLNAVSKGLTTKERYIRSLMGSHGFDDLLRKEEKASGPSG